MDILKAEDVMELSILRCKVCCRRLRSPVFRIDVLGNVCGSCYSYSAYTNAKRSIDVEILLSKLYVTCNFAVNGCTYEGPYNKTINHEERCRFRRRKCPFGYQQDCEFEYLKSEDIVEHIRNNHKTKISKLKNNYIELQNPSESCPHVFYLLQADDAFVLLRTMLKSAKDRLYYTFYHFENEEVSLALMFGERQVMLKTMHESEICHKFDTRNAFKIASEESEPFIKINLPIRDLKTYNEGDDLVWFDDKACTKCYGCAKILNEVMLYCPYCVKTFCRNCDCSSSHDMWAIKLKAIPISRLKCENAGCEQMISGGVYHEHCRYQCPFKIYECESADCDWKGCPREKIKHDFEKHSVPFNKYACLLKDINKSYFINGDDIFIHEYNIVRQKELHIKTIKLTEPFWTHSYTWSIRIKGKHEYRNITKAGHYTVSECTAILNVEEYIDEGALTVETYIRRN